MLLVKQHYQLCKQVQALQVPCLFHPSLWLWDMNRACWLSRKGPGPRPSARRKKEKKQLLHIYSEHKASDWVQNKINCLVGPQERLLSTVKRQKLAWFGHVTCLDSLSKTILQGTLEGRQFCCLQRKCWIDIKSLPILELHTMAFHRKDSAESFLMSSQWPNHPRDWTELTVHSYMKDQWWSVHCW